MATEFIFNNQKIKLPGAYSTIVSGEKNPPLALDYGKVLVIDTGTLGATWGGGAGIDGELANGQNAIYSFDNISDYRSFLKGGMLWKIADGLFRPDVKANAFGASTVIHAKAATTAAGTMTFTATGGGAAGGTFAVKCKDEGLIGNGTLASTNLVKGYGYTITAGVKDTAKWIFNIWQGQWKGNHTDGIAYDEVAQASTRPILVAQSPEFNNIQNLIDWADTNTSFARLFAKGTCTVTGTGAVTSADISGLTGYQVATGGTETYSTANLTKLLTEVAEEDYSFILCDKYGMSNYDAAEVGLIVAHINSEAKFKRFLFVGGGENEDEFDVADGSLAMAAYFNSPYQVVVHGGIGESSKAVGSGFREWPSIYTTAKVLGRVAGKEPQVPITEKTLGIDKLKHNLNKKQKEQALDAGVLAIVNKKSIGKFVVMQGVNTLQNNKNLFTNDGKSFSIQFMRIVEQINKELVINSEIDLLSDENGVNSFTLSPGILKNWTEAYLTSRVASELADNLLLSFRNVTVTKVQDAYQVTYGIVVNNEINKIFFTGFLFSE
jgi:hypothetical protein